MRIDLLVGGYRAEDVESILLQCDPRVNLIKVEEVYYPYKRIRYNVEVGMRKLSKLTRIIDCIIDLVQGSAAVGEGEPAYEQVEVDSGCILETSIPDERVQKIGHDFALKLYLNKSRLLHVPRIIPVKEELFYKRFYIAQCKDSDEKDYFVMVDAMDGGLSILDYDIQSEEKMISNK